MRKVLNALLLLVIGFGGGTLFTLFKGKEIFPMVKGEAEVVSEVSQVSQADKEVLERRVPSSFADIVKKAKPAVVNIKATKVVKRRFSPFRWWFGDPFEEFWRRFFEGVPRERVERSLGTGFIITEDGEVLTNYHVVANAEKIKVSLENGEEFQAKIIGTDKKTDIALLKIKNKKGFPHLPLGDSDKLRIGDWVIAIGNPFGLGHTVTAGIVSAKERVLGVGPYDSYIQTDAAINPGNSGGPLLNLKGEVVGINAMIYSPSGIPQNIGIGFAIPINLARSLLPQLEKKGKVTRGWLGVYIQEITPEIAESMGLKEKKGALVSEVIKDSPAEKAGIKRGDVIIEFDGKNVKSSHDLPMIVASTPVGKKVKVKVIRDKKFKELTVKVGEMPEEGGEVVAKAESEIEEKIGIRVQNITKDIAESLGLKRSEGVIVTEVVPGSPAEDAGIVRGDVILEIDRKPVRNVNDFRLRMSDALKKKLVLFLIKRENATIYIAIRL